MNAEFVVGMRNLAAGFVVSTLIAAIAWGANLNGQPKSIEVCKALCAPRGVHAFVGVTARCECESRP